MKSAFYLCWAIWWIGGIVTHYADWSVAHAICVNLFGALTVALALIWTGRWIWRRARRGSRATGARDKALDV
jgi:nicotinamide riboside transporter PnuC